MKWAALTILLLFLPGCYTVDLPRQLPEANQAAELTTGAWLVVYQKTSAKKAPKFEGELISVETDSVFFFSGEELKGIQKDSVATAKLFITEPAIRPGTAGAWMFFGTLSTVSHGWLLIVSLPVWLIAGSISAGAVYIADDRGDLLYPEDPWSELGKFARFPQGLPHGLDRSRLEVRVKYDSPAGKK